MSIAEQLHPKPDRIKIDAPIQTRSNSTRGATSHRAPPPRAARRTPQARRPSRAQMALLLRAARAARGGAGARALSAEADGFARLNVFKDGARAPAERAPAEYPAWLWALLDARATRQELAREAEALHARGGFDAVFDGMAEERLRRLFRLEARERIRASNARRSGGRVV